MNKFTFPLNPNFIKLPKMDYIVPVVEDTIK